MANKLTQYPASNNMPVDITVSPLLVVVVYTIAGGDGRTPATMTLDGVAGNKVGETTGSGGTEANSVIFEFTSPPVNGTYDIVMANFSSFGGLVSVYEFTDKVGVKVGSFQGEDFNQKASPYTVNHSVTSAQGEAVLVTLAAGNNSYGNTAPLPAIPSNLDGLSKVTRHASFTVITGIDNSVSSDPETYSATFVDNDVNGYMGRVASTSIVLVEAPNLAPVAHPETFSIYDNDSNGTTVGTYTASDDRGVTGYSITGTVFGIDGTGLITLLDNSALPNNTSLTATVTVTDASGLFDTALLTFDIVQAKTGILSIGATVAGETVNVGVDSRIDLTSVSVLTARFGGVAVTLTDVTASGAKFVVPSSGLELGASHGLVITTDGQASDAVTSIYLPPVGYLFVTLTSINSASWLSDAVYTGNAGGDANNIGIGDQIVYQAETNETNTSVAVTSTGIISMPDATVDGVITDQTISWFYLEAQQGYDNSNTQVLTLSVPEILFSVSPQKTSVEVQAVVPHLVLAEKIIITSAPTTTAVAAVVPHLSLPSGLTITPVTTTVETSTVVPIISLVFLPTTLYVRSFTVSYNQ